MNKIVYVTSNGTKYHKKSCSSIKENNYQEITLKEALKNNYDACSKCYN